MVHTVWQCGSIGSVLLTNPSHFFRFSVDLSTVQVWAFPVCRFYKPSTKRFSTRLCDSASTAAPSQVIDFSSLSWNVRVQYSFPYRFVYRQSIDRIKWFLNIESFHISNASISNNGWHGSLRRKAKLYCFFFFCTHLEDRSFIEKSTKSSLDYCLR